MILAQLSDTHICTAASEDAAGAANWQARAANLRAAVAAVNALDRSADAVIFTGDMVQTQALGEYELAREILSGLDAPLYVAPGNRDCRASLRRMFGGAGYMPGDGDRPIIYAVDDHAIRLVAFDTQSGDIRKGDVDAERLAELDRVLTERPEQPTLLFLHHPPVDVTTSNQPWQYLRREAGDEIAAVVSRHAQVFGLLCGHSHRDFQSPFAGVPVRTMPSIAIDLRLGDFDQDAEGRPLVFVHRVDGAAGRIDSAAVVAMPVAHAAMTAGAGGRKGLDEPPSAMG
ncbi:MAG: metallophosphoesterase [Rhodospirillaceae bacterium]